MNPGLRYFYMKMVLLEDVQKLVWDGGSILYVEMWNVFSRIGEKEVLYLQTVLNVSTHDAPVNMVTVLYEKEPCSVIQCPRACVQSALYKQLGRFYKLSLSSPIPMAYLLFSLIFVKVLLFRYVVCFCTTTVLFHVE